MRKKELEGYKIVSIHVHGDTWKQFCDLVRETYNERESASGMIQKFMGKYIKDEVIFVPEEPEEDDLSFDLTLEEAKESIQIQSANDETNKFWQERVSDPSDCFGKGYSSKDRECRECTILAKLKDKYDPLNTLCRAIVKSGKKE